MKRHQELLTEAIDRDGAGQRALFAGDAESARAAFREAADLYRRSWEEAPPRSYGRLVGVLKSAVLAGDGDGEAAYARHALAGEAQDSPTAAYAQALAALIDGDDGAAAEASERMRGGSDAFDRTAEAIAALAARDRPRYTVALERIVRDFEQRVDHLTGVAVADTALMLERLAARRALASDLRSEVLPRS